MDDFKKYISQHKDQLDIDEPGDDVLKKIQERLEPSNGLVVSMLLKWVAAACIILVAGFGVHFLFTKNIDKSGIAKADAPVKESTAKELKIQPEEQIENKEEHSIAIDNRPVKKEIKAPAYTKVETSITKNKQQPKPLEQYQNPVVKAFNDMEASYASMVNIQLEKIKGTPIYAEDAGYFHVFKKQFQDLNNDEKLVKEETKKNGISEDIITRMISIYQEKITLLKQLQFEINKMNNRSKSADAEVQAQTPSFINL